MRSSPFIVPAEFYSDFSSTLTTMTLYQCRLKWFALTYCKANAVGLPPSLAKLRKQFGRYATPPFTLGTPYKPSSTQRVRTRTPCYVNQYFNTILPTRHYSNSCLSEKDTFLRTTNYCTGLKLTLLIFTAISLNSNTKCSGECDSLLHSLIEAQGTKALHLNLTSHFPTVAVQLTFKI